MSELNTRRTPREYVGKTLGEAGNREAHGATVVCVKRRGEDISYATLDTVLGADYFLIVAGETQLAERFATRIYPLAATDG